MKLQRLALLVTALAATAGAIYFFIASETGSDAQGQITAPGDDQERASAPDAADNKEGDREPARAASSSKGTGHLHHILQKAKHADDSAEPASAMVPVD